MFVSQLRSGCRVDHYTPPAGGPRPCSLRSLSCHGWLCGAFSSCYSLPSRCIAFLWQLQLSLLPRRTPQDKDPCQDSFTLPKHTPQEGEAPRPLGVQREAPPFSHGPAWPSSPSLPGGTSWRGVVSSAQLPARGHSPGCLRTGPPSHAQTSSSLASFLPIVHFSHGFLSSRWFFTERAHPAVLFFAARDNPLLPTGAHSAVGSAPSA